MRQIPAPIRVHRLLACALATALLLTGPAAVAQPSQPTPCANGFAGEFPCEGVDYLSFMSLAELGGGAETKAANVWGWADRTRGREYVLLGLTDSTAFIDVTDPSAPRLVGKLPTQTTRSK